MEEPQDPPKKAKRQLTPEQLEKLAAARRAHCRNKESCRELETTGGTCLHQTFCV